MLLIIEERGARFRAGNEIFLIKLKEETIKVAPARVRSILLGPQTSVSSDAVLLAEEYEIPLFFQDRIGRIRSMIWSHKYGSISTIRRNQVRFFDSASAKHWAVDVVSAKLLSQVQFLGFIATRYKEHKTMLAESIERIVQFEEAVVVVSEEPFPALMERFRGYEGAASRIYFKALSEVFPDDWQFLSRSRRPAKDPFNAALNYLYGILYSYVMHALVIAGLDPFLGLLHTDEYNRPALVLDFIEPYRIWADAVVFRAFMDEEIGSSEFEFRPDGVFLSAFMKQNLIRTFKAFLEEVKQIREKRRSRLEHLRADARNFASYLKNEDWKKDEL